MPEVHTVREVLLSDLALADKIVRLVAAYPGLTYGDLLSAMGAELTEIAGRSASFGRELEVVLQIGARLGEEPEHLRHVPLGHLMARLTAPCAGSRPDER
jgi:hypothetical protein